MNDHTDEKALADLGVGLFLAEPGKPEGALRTDNVATLLLALRRVRDIASHSVSLLEARVGEDAPPSLTGRIVVLRLIL